MKAQELRSRLDDVPPDAEVVLWVDGSDFEGIFMVGIEKARVIGGPALALHPCDPDRVS